MTDHHLFEAWYRYAAHATGFTGEALHTQRTLACLTQEQQRAIIGLLGQQYDALWLRLQAFPLPRPDLFAPDLVRIVAQVQSECRIVAADLDLQHLEAMICAGLHLNHEGILPPKC
jgi:hypothetical protein